MQTGYYLIINQLNEFCLFFVVFEGFKSQQSERSASRAREGQKLHCTESGQ
jgi:hypothetical protein